MSSSPVRVGLMPTPWIVRPARAIDPATRKNADDEKSPGTSSEHAVSFAGGCKVTSPFEDDTEHPNPVSIRSV